MPSKNTIVLAVVIGATALALALYIHNVEGQRKAEREELKAALERTQQESRAAVERAELQAKEAERRAEEERQQREAAAAAAAAKAASEEQVSRAMDGLEDAMRARAQSEAKPKHPLSNIEACTPSSREKVYESATRVDFTELFACRMRGALFGSNSFDVQVKIRGRLDKTTGGSWEGTVVESSVESDVQR